MTLISSEARIRCPHCSEAWRLTDKEAILIAARLLVAAGEIDPLKDLVRVPLTPRGEG
jgi:hypothetical protein